MAERVEHFPNISVPTLFISGLKDNMGTPQEFADNVPSIVGETTMLYVKGGHAMKNRDDDIVNFVCTYLGFDDECSHD
jgi:predicted alpha/beta-hydrolase family hydrolase